MYPARRRYGWAGRQGDCADPLDATGNLILVMNLFPFPVRHRASVQGVAVLLLFLALARTYAAPTIASTVPPTGATGVSPTAPLVITFSEAMNTSVTVAYYFASAPYEYLPTSLAWSAGDTVLTCTPVSALPINRTILWTVMNGQNPAGQPLTGYTGGTFITASDSPLLLTNPAWAGGTFAFDVTSQAGQTFTVEYSSTLRSNQWQVLLTTNSPTGCVRIVDPHSSTNRYLFYRARNGS